MVALLQKGHELLAGFEGAPGQTSAWLEPILSKVDAAGSDAGAPVVDGEAGGVSGQARQMEVADPTAEGGADRVAQAQRGGWRRYPQSQISLQR